MKCLMHRNASQIIFILGCIPGVICYLHGDINPFGLVLIGLNLGHAIGWFLYLRVQDRADRWMRKAMRMAVEPIEIEKMIKVADGLVAARMKARNIDPDLN